MKTLFLYTVQIYLFCSCTCLLGIPQPHPNRDSSSKRSYRDIIFKKCQEVNVDVTKNSFLDPDNLLCFGLRMFSQRFPGGSEGIADFDGVVKKSDTNICKHFEEMRLNSSQDSLKESTEIYNRQFRNKETCERACLDVLNNVNPLCNVILLFSRHSKGNPIGSDSQAPSPIISGDKADNENNEVSEQSRKIVEDVPSRSLDEQKTKSSGLEPITVQQKTVSSIQGKTPTEQKLDEEDKPARQNIGIIPSGQKSQSISALTDNEGKSHEQTQPTAVRGVGSAEEKPKSSNGEGTLVTERANEQLSTSGLPEENVHSDPDNNSVINTSNKMSDSKKKSKISTVQNVTSAGDSKNEVHTNSLSQKKETAPSSVVLPESSGGGDNNEQVTATRTKLQENISTVKDRLTSKKVVTDAGLKTDKSISQVPKVEEGKGNVNSQKSQGDNKETENPPQKETELQVNSKTKTEVIPKSNTDEPKKSNTDEPKTNQNSENAYTNENAETAPQMGKTDTHQPNSVEGHSTDDAGDGVTNLQTQVAVEDGEFESLSGGGTGVEYARPESDDPETEDAGAIVFPIRDEEDDDSHFFAYFMTTMVFCIVGYLLFHNKQKILALALEGRARRGRRRPNTSGYRKLDSNLEEAISSSKSASVTQVIY